MALHLCCQVEKAYLRSTLNDTNLVQDMLQNGSKAFLIATQTARESYMAVRINVRMEISNAKGNT